MPVSRKRKKKSTKSGRSRGPARVDQRGSGAELSEQDRRELAQAWQSLTADRARIDARRAVLAAELATGLVAELVAVVASRPVVIVADALCLRLGTLLSEAGQGPLEDHVGPRELAPALVSAAVAAVAATVGDTDAWRAPWRVLSAVADVLPESDGEAAVDAIERLQDTASGRVLPAGPMVTGPVLWARDRYGSRFAVVAPIITAGAPMRWYLWDIDTCGFLAFTVHSGFYATVEAALAAWQAGVGEIAAAGTVLAEVDDPELLGEVLPGDEGLVRSGGESVAQYAEYYRGRRLAEAVMRVVPPHGTRPGNGLDAATAAVEFTAWLRAHQDELPEDMDELAKELAESWSQNEIHAVFATCSPHRVALCVLHLRDFYLDEYADRLVALLPEWTRWLAARNGTPPELADRCLPYAEGKPHPRISADQIGPNYLARIIE